MNQPVRQVVVASGHLVDAVGRAVPRFPPEAERRVAAALAAVLDRWGVGPGTLVLTQGGRGADILVAELALGRGADVRLLLPLPPAEFEPRSVDLPRSAWRERFRALVQRCPPDVLGGSGDDVFARNNERVLDVAAAAGVPVRAVVVWDRGGGDGPGGTADFVRMARERGAEIAVVEPVAVWRQPNVPYWERQWQPGPKRLLALDGGGIRGVLTLEILAEIERQLGGGDPAFVLADYFDYVAGTSTGAIIAAGLAAGRRVADVRAMYHTLGPRVFRRRFAPLRWRSLYKEQGLTDELKAFFGADTTLGADELRSLLLVVLHRSDTNSLWPLSNNSAARYNDRSRPDCNLDLPLWQVVRGSAAAPFYFLPERVRLGVQDAVFQDGGVTPFNNPALLLFEMATAPPYRLCWPAGADRLLLVSVGTGSAIGTHGALRWWEPNPVFQVNNLKRIVMTASSVENDRLCRVLGACRYGERIDNEFDPKDGVVPPRPAGADPLFSYLRYNADLSAKALGVPAERAAALTKLDAVDAIAELAAIGRAAAGAVRAEHFAGFDRTATTP